MSAATVQRKYTEDATSAHKVRKIRWIPASSTLGPAFCLLTAVLSAGCTAEATDGAVVARVSTGASAPSIFGGARDDDAEAAPGVVALRVGVGATFELCSGTLIAPNLVLTARHCVTKNVTTSVSCDENGHSANGKHVESNQDPATIGVYLGMSPSFAKLPVSIARAIVSPTGPYLCDSDIALVVLDTPISDIAPLAVRLHSTPRQGEMVRSIGYGQNDKASPIGTRFRKPNVPVLAQGKAISASATPLGVHEFELGKSICQGDSGGPAISEETGAVIGVVSRGGGCDDEFGHIYTTTAGFDMMFAEGFKLAGAQPVVENGDVASTNPSTRSNTTSGKEPAASEASAQTGGCTVGPRARDAGGVSTSGFAVIAAAFAALAARRRRARR